MIKPSISTRVICLAILTMVCVVSMVGLTACSSPEAKKQAFIEKGQRLFDQKEFVKAKLEFKNAAQIDPEFAMAYYMLGKTQMELKNYKQAFSRFSKAVDLDPEFIDARMDLGRLLLAGKAVGRAQEQAEYILLKDPEHTEGLILQASILYAKKEFEQSKAILHKLLDSHQANADIFMLLSSIARQAYDDSAAVEYIQTGLKHHPDNVLLNLKMAQIEIDRKKYENAEKHLKNIIAQKPDQIQIQLNLAKLYLDQDKINQAQDLVQGIIAADPADEKTRMMLAEFWISQHREKSAFELMEKGIQEFPDNFTYRLFLARMYSQFRRTEDAGKLLEETLNLNDDPSHPDIIKTKVALAQLHVRENHLEVAKRLADEVLSHDPKNLDARLLRGQFFLSENNAVNAISEFRLIVGERPDFEQGHLNLAMAHILNNEENLAIDVLRQAKNRIPASTKIKRDLAKLLIQKKDVAGAEDTLKEMVAQDTQNSQALLELGDFYLAGKRYEKALQQYAILKERNPSIPAGYLRTAKVYLDQNKEDNALLELKTAYACLPSSGPVFTSLIKFHTRQDRFKEAIELCKDRLSKNDQEAVTWQLLGTVYFDQKAYEQAKNCFEKAIEILPNWGRPYDSLARVYLKRNQKETAIKELNQALEKTPENASVWLILGSIYEKDMNFEKAAQVYKDACRALPEMWVPANNYASIRTELAKTDQELEAAMAYARKARELNPRAFTVYDTIGWVYFKMGDTLNAYSEVKKALDRDPDNVILNYHMGMILEKQGRNMESRVCLEKALEEDTPFHGSDIARSTLKKIVDI